MTTMLSAKPFTAVPASDDEHDQLLQRIEEIQAQITARETRLSDDNAPDQRRINERTAEAAVDLAPKQAEITRLLALSYGYAQGVLPGSPADTDRHLARPFGTFKLYRASTPEVVIDDEKLLMAELKRRGLLKLLTVQPKRVISRKAMQLYASVTATLKHAHLNLNEFYSVTSGEHVAKADVAELTVALSSLKAGENA